MADGFFLPLHKLLRLGTETGGGACARSRPCADAGTWASPEPEPVPVPWAKAAKQEDASTMAAVIEVILTNRGDMKRSLVIAVERQEQSAKTGRNREAIQRSIFIYPKGYTAIKNQLRCLPMIPANSNMVACSLPNTACSLPSAVMERLSAGFCRLLALM